MDKVIVESENESVRLIKIDKDYLKSNHLFENYLKRISDVDFDNFSILPFDILSLITKYLTVVDLIRLSMVCKCSYFYLTSDIIIRNRIYEMMVLMINKILPEKLTLNKELNEEENETILLINYFLNQRFEMNCYSVIIYFGNMVQIISYCAELCKNSRPVSNFINLMYFAHYNSYQNMHKYMRNRVLFLENEIESEPFKWMIKSSFKITDDYNYLILRIKIGVALLCLDDECFIHRYFLPKISEKKKSYYLWTKNNTLGMFCNNFTECFLPKNTLMEKIAETLKAKSNTLILRFDISELRGVYEWMLLYEFIQKVIYYESNKSLPPKFYYGEYKHIKNDKIKQLFKDLNLVSCHLTKILKNFYNYKAFTAYDKKKRDHECLHTRIIDSNYF